MGKLYLVLVKEDDLRLFTSYPQKVKEPIMVESKEEEQDYHGHFYHPYINSGKYREVWKSGKYNNGISDIISALEIRYKQFALPNMPTHWIEIPTHP